MCRRQRDREGDEPLDLGLLAGAGRRRSARAGSASWRSRRGATTSEHRELRFADVGHGLTLLGLFGLLDPPRPGGDRGGGALPGGRDPGQDDHGRPRRDGARRSRRSSVCVNAAEVLTGPADRRRSTTPPCGRAPPRSTCSRAPAPSTSCGWCRACRPAAGGRDDRRRRQRRAGAEARRRRRGDGPERHRGGEGGRRDGARRRQLRDHRRRPSRKAGRSTTTSRRRSPSSCRPTAARR